MNRIPFPAIRNRRIAIGFLSIAMAYAFIISVWPEENPAAVPQSTDQLSASQSDAVQPSATQPSEVQPSKALTSEALTSFDSYRLIWDRNIFNPNRRAIRNVEEAPRPPDPPPADRISLSGTMIFEEGSFAFFNGTQSSYRKVAKLGDEIAGFRIAAINTEGVSLERENEKLDLPVGKSLIEQEKGKWEVAEGVRTVENPRRDSNSSDRSENRVEAAAETKAADASNQGSEDILAKLKQRRSQEMKP